MGFVDSVLKKFSCHCDSDCNKKKQKKKTLEQQLDDIEFKLDKLLRDMHSTHSKIRYLAKPSPQLEHRQLRQLPNDVVEHNF